MDNPQFQQAAQYAIELLQREMLPAFTYHNADHTLDVVSACNRLAEMEKLDEEHRRLLLLAAYFHDTGLTAITGTDLDSFNAGRAVHEERSVEIAQAILPAFGCETKELDNVARLIMATKWGHVPTDLLEQIMSDADMSSIGQKADSFMRSSEALLEELRCFGNEIGDIEWYENQNELVETYRYHTASARSLYDPNRSSTKAAIQSHLNQLRSRGSMS